MHFGRWRPSIARGLFLLCELGLFFALAGCQPPSTRNAAGEADGDRVFAVYCEGCHGRDGARGNPRSHLTRARLLPDTELRAVILGGRAAMPAWKDRLGPDEVDAVIAHIRKFRPVSPANP